MAILSDLFYIHNGISVVGLDISEVRTKEFNLLLLRPSKTAMGTICGYVREDDVPQEKIFQPQTIFVSTNGEGSHTYSYVSGERFTMNSDVAALVPKRRLEVKEKIFYAYCITKNRYRFSYGRKPKGTKLMELHLPNIDEIPAWVNKTDIEKITTMNNDNEQKQIDTDGWKYFALGGDDGIFNIEPCKCSNASKFLEDGDEIDYIGAKKTEGGFMKRVKENKKLVTNGNCIIFICDGQGSVGYSNYREKDFIGSTTLSIGRNECLNKYNALFIVTVLDCERYRYSFGRKYKTKLEKVRIKLPEKKGQPDWDYMEQYIKALPYGDRI